jgi:mRNA-degrading endonuclease toxin of MazEF toxin-antitoxin module
VPGNVLLPSQFTNLPDDSVANASLVISVDKELLTEHVGKLPRAKLELVLAGLDAVVGR